MLETEREIGREGERGTGEEGGKEGETGSGGGRERERGREREKRGSKRTNKRRGESNRRWKEKRVCTCMQLETESKLTYPSSEYPSFYIVCLPKTTAISCVDTACL